MKRHGWVACVTVLSLSLPSIASAATIVVDPRGGGDFAEIQPALDAASDGDTVLVRPGEYSVAEPIDFNRLHLPDDPLSPPVKNLTLVSQAGPEETVLRFATIPTDPLRASVAVFQSGEGPTSVLEGFTLTAGRGTRWGQEAWQWGGGGILCVGSSPTVRSCKITRNNGGWNGGGICCDRSAPILVNCLVVENASSSVGGVCSLDTWPVGLNSCTVAANLGMGVVCGSQARIENCIVWGNTAGAISTFSALFPRVAHSCVDSDDPWLQEGEGNLNRDPWFVEIGSWDGETVGEAGSRLRGAVAGDYHLQPESPVIDAGTSEGAPAADIEGNARPCGAGVDMGAYEYGECAPPAAFRRGDTDSSGNLDLSDAIYLLGHLFLGGGKPGCLDAADADDSGSLEITDAIAILSYLFLGSGPLPAPGAEACGEDPGSDDLPACVYPAGLCGL